MSERDLVFVSYAHEDRKWLEDLQTFLKPYERSGQLEVWADPYIPVGSDWHREITEALDRTGVAVALITQDFINSDFIVETELPAMRAAADAGEAVLVAVPVSAATHDALGLDDLQWARSPDQPLDQLRKAKRNKALVKLAHIIRDAAARTDEDADRPDVAPVARFALGPSVVDTVAATGTTLAPLHGVPAQRPNFVPRLEDRERVVAALLGETFAVGVTGASRVGVHGQGGIGKSVLAIDVVHQEPIRRAFPDGIFWVTIGQAPKLLDLQAELARQLTGSDITVDSVRNGVETLRSAFAARRSLLVLDDVWSTQHTAAFDVLASESRLLLTTRDRQVVSDVGAAEARLDVLGDGAARDLLARWVGGDPATLPDSADVLIEEAGHLPLAISVAGALIAEGAGWHELVGQLQAGRLDYLDHPYGDVFASIQLGIDALDEDDQQRLIELAVFPEDVHVPRSVIERLWARTGGISPTAAGELLERFDQRALLYVNPDDGGVSFHDLQHDFLRLAATDLRSVHLALVDAYWPAGTELPRIGQDERYVWERLGYHISEAGATDRLRQLLLDPAWMRTKLAATDITALIEDYDAEPHDPDVSDVGAALRKSAHVIGVDPAQLPSQLLGRLGGIDRPGIRTLCAAIDRAASGPWLRPLTPTLRPPGVGERLTLQGHRGAVNDVAVTPDARHAVSAGDDTTACVWDLSTGTAVTRLTGHSARIWAVAITPDGQEVLTGDGDGEVLVWNLAAEATVARLDGHRAAVRSVAVTPSGRHAVTGSDDHTVRIWDLATRVEVARFEGHHDAVNAVAVTPDGQAGLSAGDDGTMQMWSLPLGIPVARFGGHLGAVDAIAISPQGGRAVTVGGDQRARIWDLAGHHQVGELEGHYTRVRAVTITPDGRNVITGSSYRAMWIWDLATGERIGELEGHTGAVTEIVVAADQRQVVTSGDDETVRVWDLSDDVGRGHEGRHSGWVTGVAITHDHERALSVSGDRSLRTWDLATGTEIGAVLDLDSWIEAIAVEPDGWTAVTGASDGTATSWELVIDSPRGHLVGHLDRVNGVAITPDGQRAITASDDHTARIWDLDNFAQLGELVGHTNGVNAVAISQDGNRAITGDADHLARIWDLTTGEDLLVLDGHTDWVRAVAFTQDGSHAVTASDDKTVTLWDLVTPAAVCTFTAEGWVMSLAVDHRIVAGDENGQVHFLHLELPAE
ncbi:MAG: NB-ARC domain-containing protein [Actinomycetota bacterium]